MTPGHTNSGSRDPLLAILRGLHDAVSHLASTTHWAAERARESLAVVDQLLKAQEETDRLLSDETVTGDRT